MRCYSCACVRVVCVLIQVGVSRGLWLPRRTKPDSGANPTPLGPSVAGMGCEVRELSGRAVGLLGDADTPSRRRLRGVGAGDVAAGAGRLGDQRQRDVLRLPHRPTTAEAAGVEPPPPAVLPAAGAEHHHVDGLLDAIFGAPAQRIDSQQTQRSGARCGAVHLHHPH